jgi:hypothetical protein
MSDTLKAQRNRHSGRLFSALATLSAIGVVLVGLLGCDPSASSTTGSPVHLGQLTGLAHLRRHSDVPGELPRASRDDQHGRLDIADGEVLSDVTVFDDHYPAVAKLEPALLSALRSAATAARKDGVQMYVNSGWRSRSYQAQLFRKAVAQYGSADQAARWVARPGTSAHEAGQAVDLGPSAATSWLSQHGAAYGLCQIYANEPWHYELRPEAVRLGCPAMYADPTQDPRLQR